MSNLKIIADENDKKKEDIKKDFRPCDCYHYAGNTGIQGCQECFEKCQMFKMKKECENCAKQKTMECPNSSLCYNTKDKPYFEPKSYKFAKAIGIVNIMEKILKKST